MTMNYDFIYHKIQLTIEQDSYIKTNESGEEAPPPPPPPKKKRKKNETNGLIDIGLPQSKTNIVNSNSKARMESKIQCRQV